MLPVTENDRHLARFKELILQTCGFHLELGREQTLIEALKTRMAARGIDGPLAYHGLLLRDREELSRLVELLTVNETYFFREPDYLRLVVDKLVPEFLGGGGPVRILSAGCSTGEEPYSIAMMLRERYGVESERLFRVTGVDIDSCAIAAARRGVYGKGSFRGMDAGLLERYFDPAGQWEYRIREGIGTQVKFEVANLLDPAYPQSMQHPDVIFYRNVSIYFPKEVQRRIFAALAGLLKPGGYLMVGATETFHHDLGVLTLVERGALFFYRKAPVVEERRRDGSRGTVVEERRRFSVRPESLPRAGAAGRAQQSGAVAFVRPPATVETPAAGVLRTAPNRALEEREAAIGFVGALEAARAGQGGRALELLDRIAEDDPCYARACGLKGSLLLATARYDEAAAVCAGLLACDPLCLEACLMLGIIARHQGDNAGAFKRFREAAYLDPACWLAHFYTAEILFQQGDGKRARSGYETVSRLLEKGADGAHGEAIFQLSFNAEQFRVICRHKLSLLKENG